ncbi:hypothetical protein [Flavivirga eckloniae]|uniref:Uncharacterized protein n=1 Tax=Flavivirga eckloniae TaxID=1803846 RepID=A0A2K9PLF2_9FLAO|nr:hypothetical protein [Flavivirga eckloniae]AUP77894.1 hypothetical protein C1H87_03870 [Flavivirga eckloniae]
MMKNKNQSRISLIILIFVAICYIGFQHYSNYKKKESYKRAIVSELRKGLWYIEEVFYDNINLEKKETDQLFNSFLEGNTSLNEVKLLDLRMRLSNMSSIIQLHSDYFRNKNWKAAQQSGVLSQFSLYELKQLNLAYNKSEELIEIGKQIQEFGFRSPSFDAIFDKKISSKLELEFIYKAYQRLFFDHSRIVKRTRFEYHDAIKMLDPENEYLKQLISLKNQKKKTKQDL